MKLVAAVLIASTLGAAPAAGQHWRGHEPAAQGSRTWSSHGSGWGYNGQADRPGDSRCDPYWDRGRDDCDAGWRDQRPFARHHGSTHGHRGYGQGGYNRAGGGYVYQPYSQGAQYWGAYGRPDQVYPGYGYAGQVGHPGAGWRDPNRAAWCAATYRSYDPVSGNYRAYSGRLVFCG